ncbi:MULTISPECIES: TolC family protein [Robiginitalea]|nr:MULTISPECIES: TolC family protein [Robiginitalea]MDC6354887.1 TolC family protein [Robiginitalea sp. PM2]MDC6375153.1 TolC family protein [Robiginitalea sp. SP8]
MQKHFVFAICGCLFLSGVFAQTPEIDGILQQIEQNNRELQAISSYLEGRKLELKSGNNLPDPQFGFFYLPNGDNSTGDYTEFQVSQTIEFPTVYGARGTLIEEQETQLELEYLSRRQEILLRAKGHGLELIYLNKRIATEQERLEQARTVMDQVEELYRREQNGILELNKAKVAWLQDQFKVQQLENERRNVRLLLQNLNGGTPLKIEGSEFSGTLDIADLDVLWQDRLVHDADLVLIRQEEVIAAQALAVSRNKSLPNLTAGYNQQGVPGAIYSGLYAGISLPLWSNRNKVKSARSHLEFQEVNSTRKTQEARTRFEKQVNEYQMMLSRYREYQTTLSGMDSESLLMEAYQLGEISFMDYYRELQFYRDAYDSMIKMEYELFRQQAELLKHKL